jgi:hypothetical protein
MGAVKGATRDAFVVLCALATAGVAAMAQDGAAPHEFGEFRGTWRYDAAASTHDAQLSLRIARVLVIATSPTAITLTKDGGLPEVYPLDGSETQIRDPRTGAPLDPRYSFRLVAGALALMTKTSSGNPVSQRLTNIVADAYRVTRADTLTVERQLSVLVEPPGSLKLLGGLLNHTDTLVYRRCDASC